MKQIIENELIIECVCNDWKIRKSNDADYRLYFLNVNDKRWNLATVLTSLERCRNYIKETDSIIKEYNPVED